MAATSTTTRKAAPKTTTAKPRVVKVTASAEISKRRSGSQFVGVHDAMLAKDLRPARVLALGPGKGFAVVEKASIVKDGKGEVVISKLKVLAGPVASQSACRRLLYAYEAGNPSTIVKPGKLTQLRAKRAKEIAARKSKAVAKAKAGTRGNRNRPTRARKAA